MISLKPNKNHGFDSGAAARGCAGGCGWRIQRSSRRCSESWNISLPSIFPGLDDCKEFVNFCWIAQIGSCQKTKLILQKIWSHLTKTFIAWSQRSEPTPVESSQRKKEQRSNYILPTFCLINPFSSLVAQFIFYYCPRWQLQKWNT